MRTMRRARLLPLALIGALAACVGPGRGDRGPEFVGRPLRVEAANGALSTLFLRPDGSVEARFNGNATEGRWEFREGMLCYFWKNGSYRECWPHEAPFEPGRTETVRSDRGNVVKVTME
jgi:hypothetical protein